MTDIPAADPFSLVLIALMKGVTERGQDAALWQSLLQLQARVRDHFAPFGLELMIDEAEGYAYLRQRPVIEGAPALPRLVARRQLSYPVSLLLVLLRKRLAEFDATSGDPRLVLSREQIAELIRLFLPDTPNQAKWLDRLDQHIAKVVELGFLRRLRGEEGRFEICRIIKAFVDAQWLGEFHQRLAAYAETPADIAEAVSG